MAFYHRGTRIKDDFPRDTVVPDLTWEFLTMFDTVLWEHQQGICHIYSAQFEETFMPIIIVQQSSYMTTRGNSGVKSVSRG